MMSNRSKLIMPMTQSVESRSSKFNTVQKKLNQYDTGRQSPKRAQIIHLNTFHFKKTADQASEAGLREQSTQVDSNSARDTQHRPVMVTSVKKFNVKLNKKNKGMIRSRSLFDSYNGLDKGQHRASTHSGPQQMPTSRTFLDPSRQTSRSMSFKIDHVQKNYKMKPLPQKITEKIKK